jgi:hypothetical protein
MMHVKNLFSDARKISKIATVITFIALIRCIAEPMRLQSVSAKNLIYHEIAPYLIASLIAAICLFVITVLHYYGKYKVIIAISVLNIVLLLVVKQVYLLP